MKNDGKWYDAFTRSATEDDDVAQLRWLFVDSVLHNVERVHAIRFLSEEHDTGGGTSETDRLVEVTFTNAVGTTVHVDGILEKFNMADWRVICDKLCERMLAEVGEDPEPWEWETPRPHVTYVPGWDGDDVIDTVTIVWRVPEKLWNRIRGFWETKGSRLVDADEVCPKCGREVRMKWDAGRDGMSLFCPFCGTRMSLCSECDHDAADCAECGRTVVPPSWKPGCRWCDAVHAEKGSAARPRYLAKCGLSGTEREVGVDCGRKWCPDYDGRLPDAEVPKPRVVVRVRTWPDGRSADAEFFRGDAEDSVLWPELAREDQAAVADALRDFADQYGRRVDE